ncbi:MAG: VOC family protein [Bacteroidota bacterium]
MQVGTHYVDHIVYAVPDLEAATKDLSERLGVRPTFGGYHRDQGTKNALLNVGEGCYLEVIAADVENETISSPRWMGVDLITTARITRWSLKSQDLIAEAATLRAYDAGMGVIHGGQRQTAAGDQLAWQMTLPLAAPVVEIAPFITAWGAASVHPTASLAQACHLRQIVFTHPTPERVAHLFRQLGVTNPVQKHSLASIRILLETSKGMVWL